VRREADAETGAVRDGPLTASSSNTTVSRTAPGTFADSRVEAGDVVGSRGHLANTAPCRAGADPLERAAPLSDRGDTRSPWGRLSRPDSGGGFGAGPPFVAAPRRPGIGHTDCCRRSATVRRVSSVCWWCCTDWRSSAPRCHVTPATMAATRAITPRSTTVVITTIQPNAAALGYLGFHPAFSAITPCVRSPSREVVRSPGIPVLGLGGVPGGSPARSQNWGMAGNAYSAGACRGGSRRARAAAIVGPSRSAFTFSVSSARSRNSGMTSRAKSSMDSQMCS